MFFLVGDIGGTNTRLALFEGSSLVQIEHYRNQEMGSLEACLEDFNTRHGRVITAAVFGAAGPVEQGQIKMTNLNWSLDQTDLSAHLGVPVRLLNDFHIQALGTLPLCSTDYESLGNARVVDPEKLAVIGAGTGLGEAILTRSEGEWVVIPGEGGHKRFAPKNEREINLLRLLFKRWPEHVSVERIASGPGLVNVYDALRGETPRHPRMTEEDPAIVISEEALSGGCTLCIEVLHIFVDTLADEAANLALQSRADCVYVSGGIPTKILPILKTRFRTAFEAKGRYRSLLAQVEVRIVHRPFMALEGAAVAAVQLTRA